MSQFAKDIGKAAIAMVVYYTAIVSIAALIDVFATIEQIIYMVTDVQD